VTVFHLNNIGVNNIHSVKDRTHPWDRPTQRPTQVTKEAQRPQTPKWSIQDILIPQHH